MRKSGLLLIMLAVACAGCATAPAPRTIINAFSFSTSLDTVWSATVETFAELNLPIDNMEKDSGLITTDWINFTGTGNKEWCDCGGLGIAVENSRRGKFNVFVKQTGTTVSVRVNCQFQQVASLGGTVVNRECVSTGSLESRINSLIASKVGN